MKKELSAKQKIIVVGIIILVSAIGGYGFVSIEKEKSMQMVSLDDVYENQNEENIIENNTSEDDEMLEEKIVVHITGEVNKVGIVILKQGARIADAIEAAGGATVEADLDEINLAYLLEDGMKIYIPNKKEINVEKEYITSNSGNNVIVKDVKSGGVSKKVNLNTASQSELETLPGIGPSIANRIIEYRDQNGKFSKIEDLQNIKGIGDAKFANIKEQITVK